MKSLVIFGCVAILSTVIFLTFSSSRNENNLKKFIGKSSHNLSSNAKPLHLNDQTNNLFWFVQISDIHISIFREEERIDELRKFVSHTLDTIKPPVVLASGDLTDAKDWDLMGSRQYEAEWKIYHEILTRANVKNKTLWLDVRGNHDNFNVPTNMLNNTFYKRYSMQGGENKRSYMKIVNGSSGDKYSFIAVDASLQPGPKRPFNFVGLLKESDTDILKQFIERSRKEGVNYTIWFGHYPTSCVVTPEDGTDGLRRIISSYENSLAYMCGHLHTLAGLIPNMYTLQNDSFLELEVADWKSCRMYRVAAIDNGLLSFTDVKQNDWPVILITNPKHSLYRLPNRHEAKLQLESTHIRLLAFSPAGINDCIVHIDNDLKQKCTKINENLFVVSWNPEKYKNGIHYITATVIDDYGRKKQIMQPFRLDEKQSLSFDALAQFVLRTDVSTIFKGFFLIAMAMCIAPLITLRILHHLVLAGYLNRRKSVYRSSMSWFQKYWILSSIDRIFWPIIFYCIYISIGPWAICEVVDGEYGALFIWGVYIHGNLFPGSLTYLYATSQLVICQFPLIWIFSKGTAKRFYQVIGMPTKNHRGSMLNKVYRLAFYMIIAIEVLLLIYFGVYYGIVSIILGPFRTWSIFMNILLYYFAQNVPDHQLKPAMYAWSGTDKPINDQQQRSDDESNDESHTN